MTKQNLRFTYILLFILGAFSSFAQPKSIAVVIKNCPSKNVVLGLVKGDGFIPLDSTVVENQLVRFSMPDNSKTALYRLVLGKEISRHVDFIFNNEDVVIETDYKSPQSKTRILESDENKVWFAFKSREEEFAQKLLVLEKDVNYYWEKEITRLVTDKANAYNQLQIERDLFIAEYVKNSESMWASKLIQTYKRPLLDGYLSKEERRSIFQKEFLSLVDFTDESLIYSQAYTDKIFNFLLSFNQSDFTQEQREASYIKAVNEIYQHTNKNANVSQFIKEYLLHGFNVLKLNTLVKYVNDKYSEN